jgi:integrase
MLMPRKLPPLVERWRDRHGKLRTYGRPNRKGPRVPLPDFGTVEFKLAYGQMLAGDLLPPQVRPRVIPGSIEALIINYKRSAAYIDLRDTTKTGYTSRLETLRAKHGHRRVDQMTRERIVAGILEPYTGKPGASLAILKILRVLIRRAIEIGWLKFDPSLGIKRPKGKEVRSWTDAEITIFEKRWPIGTKQRLAFALMLFTGQRRSDVHRMTWADVNGDTIRVVQQKTGAKLTIRLHDELRNVLAVEKRKQFTIVNTTFGKPFTVDGFGGWLRAAISAAGLPLDAKPHGLRKAAGRRLAEAGCTAHEIMSVLGHKTLAEAERYTRDADQAHLASQAVVKLEAHKKNVHAQTSACGLGKNRKTKGKSK